MKTTMKQWTASDAAVVLQPALRRIARKLSADDASLADDLVQEMSLAVLECGDDVHGLGYFRRRGYLRALNYLRDEGRRVHEDVDLLSEDEHPTCDPFAPKETSAVDVLVQRCLRLGIALPACA